MDEIHKADLDRLVELASAGAVQAGEALAQLVGIPVETGAPVVVSMSAAEDGVEVARLGSDPDSSGVFFEFEGCLDAIIGILFPDAASELLVRRIVGIESGELEPTVVESALMEVGNILASHVASAIADRLGSRLLPSIPSLAMSDAEVELEAFIDRLVGPLSPRIESRLVDQRGSLIGRLVLVPTR